MGQFGGQFVTTAAVDETMTTRSTPVSEHALSTLRVPLTAVSSTSVCITMSRVLETV